MSEAPQFRHAPATEAQQGQWLLRELGREPAPLCRAWHVTGALDVPRLAAAWRALVERHEALRSALVTREGTPERRTRVDAGPEAFRFRGLDDAPAGFATLGLAGVAGPGDAAEPAPSEHAQLAVIRHGEGEYRVRLSVPRAFGDEAFLDTLVSELSLLCDEDNPDLAWWRSTLTPLPSDLQLPADRPRPAQPLAGAGLVVGTVDPQPFAVMLAALQALLHRYTGADRVAVAVLARNLLVLPADFAEGSTFREVLEASRADEALRHDVPLARVLATLPVPRDARRVPLCDVVFTYRTTPAPALALAGAVAEPCREPGPADADLLFSVDGSVVSLSYDADQFDQQTAEMILRHYRTLLRHASEAPDTAIADLVLETAEETERAVSDADRRIGDGLTHTAVELIRRQALADPEAIAVDAADGPMSYQTLRRTAAHVAQGLRAAGVRPGDPVVVRLPVGALPYAALLGVLEAGAHLCWFGVGDAGDRGRAVVSDLKPAALLVASDSGPDDLAEWYRTETGGPVIAVEAKSAADASFPEPPSSAPPPPPPTLDDLAYVAYTSGSTGAPKGIAQTHAALAQFAGWLAAEFDLGPAVRVAQWVTPEHDPALAETFAALVSGATLCPVPDRIRANPERFVDWLAQERISVLQTVPSFARELFHVITERRATERLAELRVLLLMGEALPGDLAAGLRSALPLARVANLYGPTETVAATWHEITGPLAGPAPIGRSIPGRLVLVLDAEDRPCPAGVTGELVIAGRYVADGYLGSRAQDHPAFAAVPGIEGPCYRTGDLARRRADGALEYRGRKDSQVKLLGSRLELADVEAALAGHESVAECAVVAVADQDGLAVRLVVCVVPRRGPDGAPLGAPDAWRSHLRRRFGRALLPALYRTMDRLPRTPTGKVDRRRLNAQVAAATRSAVARAPATVTEKELAAVWAGLLGAVPEHVDESFFALGGSSLQIPVLLRRVRERLAVPVSAADVYTHQTLAALAALIDRSR
ncbi:amino acid adenylation domain-containing protein [Catenulispora subtropica]|uniref:Carrier domain-containing protein n=1 Tax=Catenulispora subtropica TaxID=450798 RepID=A0ABN2T3D7_9ACTN